MSFGVGFYILYSHIGPPGQHAVDKIDSVYLTIDTELVGTGGNVADIAGQGQVRLVGGVEHTVVGMVDKAVDGVGKDLLDGALLL